MSWGDASIYVWGGFEYGFSDPARFEAFSADAVIQLDDIDLTYEADAILQARDTDITFDADSVVFGTLEVSFGADALLARLPSEDFKKRTFASLLLVELRLPNNNTFRFSSTTVIHDNKAWEGRLINAGEIERSAGQKQDSIRIQIDDTNTTGNSLSAIFSNTTPPEGSEVTVFLALRDKPVTDRLHLFEGKIEQIIGVSEAQIDIEIVRQDAVDDKELGRVITATDFPDAPDESLGSIVPIVFGTVDRHEGVVTNFNARTSLTQVLQKGDTVAILSDGSKFPATGSAKIDDEIFTWGSKTGINQLNITVRGDSGTQEDDHSEGSELIEDGDFVVKFADHAVGSITNVKLPDEKGNLVLPAPFPVIDAPNALATFSSTPKIRVPSRSTEYVRAAFDADSGSTAANALAAARENIGFSELVTANIGAGQALELSRSEDLGEPGEITRVFAVIVYDPRNFTQAGSQVSIPGLSLVLGSLNGNDNTPVEISRRDYKTLGLTHDVVDPTHVHASTTTTRIIRPRSVISAVNWNFASGAVDDDAVSQAITGVTKTTMRLGGAIFSLSSGEIVTSFKLRVIAGGGGTAQIFQSSYGISLPGFLPFISVVGPSPAGTTLTRTFETITFAGAPSGISNVGQWEWRIVPINPSAGRNYNIRLMEMEVTVASAVTAAATNISQNRGVAQYFDVTDSVGGDWSFFTDAARGDRLRVTNTSGNLRVLNMYYVIEFNPFIESAGEVPRVFGDVVGLVPDGDPIDILEQIIVGPSPRGLGLDASRIDRGLYNTAQAALDADSMRSDLSIRNPTSAIGLLGRIANEVGLRQFWDQSQHAVVRKPDPASLPAVFRTYRKSDVKEGSIVRSRTSIQDVINLLEVRLRPDDFIGDFTEGDSQSDAPSQVIFGERKETFELNTIRDLATAQAEVARSLNRSKFPRWVLEFSLYLQGIELRRGDIISLQHREFSFTKGEVLAIDLNASERPLTVRVRTIVWED